MGWAVGRDSDRRRHIGYGVPATCDHPGCPEGIDRGMAYRCGEYGEDDGCGLYFCDEHRTWAYINDGEDDHPTRQGEYCERCVGFDPEDGSTWLDPFEPSPDTREWAEHVLTDDSWAQWRDEEPEWADRMRELVA